MRIYHWLFIMLGIAVAAYALGLWMPGPGLRIVAAMSKGTEETES